MFNSTSEKQGSVVNVGLAGAALPDLRHWADGFLVARRASGIAASTIAFRRKGPAPISGG